MIFCMKKANTERRQWLGSLKKKTLNLCPCKLKSAPFLQHHFYILNKSLNSKWTFFIVTINCTWLETPVGRLVLIASCGFNFYFVLKVEKHHCIFKNWIWVSMGQVSATESVVIWPSVAWHGAWCHVWGASRSSMGAFWSPVTQLGSALACAAVLLLRDPWFGSDKLKSYSLRI